MKWIFTKLACTSCFLNIKNMKFKRTTKINSLVLKTFSQDQVLSLKNASTDSAIHTTDRDNPNCTNIQIINASLLQNEPSRYDSNKIIWTNEHSTSNTGVVNSNSLVGWNTGLIYSNAFIIGNSGLINTNLFITGHAGLISSNSFVTENTGINYSSLFITCMHWKYRPHQPTCFF